MDLMTMGSLSVEQVRAERYLKYYLGKQYEGKASWDDERDADGNYVSVRRRKPGLRKNICKSTCNRIAGFLMGSETFPEFKVDKELLGETLKWLRENVYLRKLPSACKWACVQGSVGLSFGFVRGKLLLRTWRRDQAWPFFDDADELAALVVMYQGIDRATGKALWFRMILDSDRELWESSESSSGGWREVSSEEHGFGFVPGVWVRHLSDEAGVADGESIIEDIIEGGIQEEVDYSASQRSRALRYTSDPQAVIQDENPEEAMNNLIKSPSGTWFLGKDGKVYFLEIKGEGIKLMGEMTRDLAKDAQELARVVLPDPDRTSGAMSGFALRMMNEPMIDLADQLQATWTPALLELTAKVLSGAKVELAKNNRVRIPGIEDVMQFGGSVVREEGHVTVKHPWLGAEPVGFRMPGFATDLFNLTAFWGSYFDESPEEEQRIVGTATSALAGGLVSRETAVRAVGPYLGVGDVDEELRRIDVERGAVDDMWDAGA